MQIAKCKFQIGGKRENDIETQRTRRKAMQNEKQERIINFSVSLREAFFFSL
jgi:hypothetical protein